MRHLTRHMTWKAFVCANLTTSFCAVVLKKYTLVKFLEQWLTGGSSLEELNREGILCFGAKSATPTAL